MFDFINDHLGIIISASIVAATATGGAYIFGDYGHSSYDRFMTFVMKLIGFLAALVVIPITPYIVYAVYTNTTSDEADPIVFFLLTFTVMACAVSMIHFIGFPLTVFRLVQRRR